MSAVAALGRRSAWLAPVAALVLVAAVACTSSSGATGPDAGRTDGGGPGSVSAGGGPGTTAVVGPAHASGRSAGCDAAPPVPPGTTDVKVSSGGVERSYELVVPPSYDGTKPYSLLFGLHALTVDYRFVPSMTDFDKAAQEGFIGVSPSGRVDGRTAYWNAAPVADNYDVAFLGELLDQLEATLCLDTGKVFSTGMSNGAQMSSLLACRMPERITAIAPVSGVEFLEPCDGAPVPILAFHGAEDPILPYTGGGLNATKIADTQFYKGNLPPGLPAPLGVDESMRRWAAHNRCDPDYVEERVSPEVRKRTWQHCAAATILYIVDNGGHAWPGKPQPAFEQAFGHGTTDIDASQLMFDFFFRPQQP